MRVSKRVDATLADLRALQDPELAEKIDVRCRQCRDGKIRFAPHPSDPAMSSFYCDGKNQDDFYGYNNSYCGASHRLQEVETALPFALATAFCVEVYYPETKVHKLVLEDRVGTTAFHYLREATVQEHWTMAEAELERIRRLAK